MHSLLVILSIYLVGALYFAYETARGRDGFKTDTTARGFIGFLIYFATAPMWLMTKLGEVHKAKDNE